MLETEEPVTWFIDRVGDPSIRNNINSINYTPYRYINSYFIHELNSISDINNEDEFIISNEYEYILNDVQPSIFFGPEVKIEVVVDMQINKEEEDCCVCQEDKKKTDICRLKCSHTFCGDCVKKIMVNQRICPLCRTEITGICVQNNENKEKVDV
jgi:hypothetical protein